MSDGKQAKYKWIAVRAAKFSLKSCRKHRIVLNTVLRESNEHLYNASQQTNIFYRSGIVKEIFYFSVRNKYCNMTCLATNSVPLSTSAICMDISTVNGSIPASSYIPFHNPSGRDVLYYELCSCLPLSNDGPYRWAIHTLFISLVGPLLL
jgi:hypothetical protein